MTKTPIETYTIGEGRYRILQCSTEDRDLTYEVEDYDFLQSKWVPLADGYAFSDIGFAYRYLLEYLDRGDDE